MIAVYREWTRSGRGLLYGCPSESHARMSPRVVANVQELTTRPSSRVQEKGGREGGREGGRDGGRSSLITIPTNPFFSFTMGYDPVGIVGIVGIVGTKRDTKRDTTKNLRRHPSHKHQQALLGFTIMSSFQSKAPQVLSITTRACGTSSICLIEVNLKFTLL